MDTIITYYAKLVYEFPDEKYQKVIDELKEIPEIQKFFYYVSKDQEFQKRKRIEYINYDLKVNLRFDKEAREIIVEYDGWFIEKDEFDFLVKVIKVLNKYGSIKKIIKEYVFE